MYPQTPYPGGCWTKSQRGISARFPGGAPMGASSFYPFIQTVGSSKGTSGGAMIVQDS